jgi:hypothetical protein
MLNIEVNRNADGVERYFDRELAVSDYLMKEPGIWAGRGAERLGLRGPVQRSQFVALLRNENPTTGKRLTARMNTSRQEDGETVSNRQVGYGLVFGVPKSLSIYLAITRDQVVENIARSAVDETMGAMEYEMQCKVRKGGQYCTPKTQGGRRNRRGGSRGHRSAPHGSRVRSVPGSLTLRAWPGSRIPQPDRGRISARREVDRERNELRDRDAGEQWEGPSVQTIC